MKRGYLDRGIARAGPLMDRGATLDGHVLTVDAAGNCERPVGFSHTYTASMDRKPYPATRAASDVSMWMDGEARCRRCPACLAYRRKLWTARAIREVKSGQRNWFGTLTLNPTTRQRYLAEARERVRASSLSLKGDWDALEPNQRFAGVVRLLNRDLTLFLKRVREESGASLRYMFAVERHVDGTPHMHGLVHEVGQVPVRERTLSGQWRHLGFAQWRLVKPDPGEEWKAPYYVAKYLAKDALARVRASVGYGGPTAVVPGTVAVDPPKSLDIAQREVPDPQAEDGSLMVSSALGLFSKDGT